MRQLSPRHMVGCEEILRAMIGLYRLGVLQVTNVQRQHDVQVVECHVTGEFPLSKKQVAMSVAGE
jgi:hypothetical protein